MNYNKLVNLLEQLLNEEIDARSAENIFEEQFANNRLEYKGYHLSHYFDDEDVRNNDLDYKKFQNDELKKLIHYLKVGDFFNAEEISFLQSTPDLQL